MRTWKLALACGLGALVAGLCPSASSAQATATPVQPVRVAFVNMQEVMKLYPRYKALQDELKKKDDEYLNMVKSKNGRAEALQKEYQTTTDEKKRAAIEQDLRQLKLEIETIVADAKKTLAKYFDEQVAQIYVEFYSAVAEVAKSNGFDVVWRYNEDWTQENYNKPENIVRRAMSNPVFPMFYDQKKLDVTYRVVQYLSQKYPTPAGSVTGTPVSTTAPNSVVPAGATTAPGGAPR
jgi:Skp family chaperone for outer membrane proteins